MNARIEHVAIWAHDLEALRAFYTDVLGGTSGPRYENPATGFTSYFITFGDGPRLELMHRPGIEPARPEAGGSAHIALALGSRAAVDEAVATLRDQGVAVASDPRMTGDGYYEAVILDPEGNRVELTV
ncbi:MAG TPA: VOC family protein [Gemmatimonadales bacterium]|nr:VOC family protein [Gemmatimonadales bacterium]